MTVTKRLGELPNQSIPSLLNPYRHAHFRYALLSYDLLQS
jgi:hypothetical protein